MSNVNKHVDLGCEMRRKDRLKVMYNEIMNSNIYTTKEFIDNSIKQGTNYLTAIRDLHKLRDSGLINIELGRIEVSNNERVTYSRNENAVLNIYEKKIISNEACKLIGDNDDAIYISSGTTCEFFAKNINKKIDLVVTNGFEIFNLCSHNPNIIDVILLGGKFNRKSSSFVGDDAIEILGKYRFNKCFITAPGIKDDNNIYNSNEYDGAILKKVIEISKMKILLVDSTKFIEDTGVRKITSLSEMDYVIVDHNIENEKWKKISSLTKVIIAK